MLGGGNNHRGVPGHHSNNRPRKMAFDSGPIVSIHTSDEKYMTALSEEMTAHDVLAEAQTDREFLAPIHVYVLANLLKRPILVYADEYARGVNMQPV